MEGVSGAVSRGVSEQGALEETQSRERCGQRRWWRGVKGGFGAV